MAAIGLVRAEAAEGLQSMETVVGKKFALSEAVISKRHSEELRRVELEHQVRLNDALRGMENEKNRVELEHQQRLGDALRGLENAKNQLRRSAELVHANVVQASSAAQETSSRIIQEQRAAAESALL
eukprot:5926189-Amphidinium_carterae.5